MQEKEHKVIVSVTSVSGGVVNDVHSFEEGCSTSKELVRKTFHIDAAITKALQETMADLAAADGFIEANRK